MNKRSVPCHFLTEAGTARRVVAEEIPGAERRRGEPRHLEIKFHATSAPIMLDGFSVKNELKMQLDPYFNEIKDLIKSTARGTETVLRKEMKSSETALRKEFKEGLEANQNAIRSVKEEVESVKKDVEFVKKDVENLRVEMNSKMDSMESRLSDKIDSLHTRLDEHEAKPINLAHPQQ